jgi:hypothetical protein
LQHDISAKLSYTVLYHGFSGPCYPDRLIRNHARPLSLGLTVFLVVIVSLSLFVRPSFYPRLSASSQDSSQQEKCARKNCSIGIILTTTTTTTSITTPPPPPLFCFFFLLLLLLLPFRLAHPQNTSNHPYLEACISGQTRYCCIGGTDSFTAGPSEYLGFPSPARLPESQLLQNLREKKKKNSSNDDALYQRLRLSCLETTATS